MSSTRHDAASRGGAWERRRGAKILIVLCCAVIVPFEAWFLWRFAITPGVYQAFNTSRIEERFGFDHGSPYMGDPGCRQEVLQIVSVAPGSAFATGGVRSGEILGPDGLSFTEWLERLDALEPGASMEMSIVTPLEVGCMSDWPARTVRIVAP